MRDSPVRVKICGITRTEDALLAESLGASAVGFVFHRPSPRYIPPETAGAISGSLGACIARVGVFVDMEPRQVVAIARQACLTAVQLHGDEPPETMDAHAPYAVIKAFRVGDDFPEDRLHDYRVSTYLLDTFVPGMAGGTGKRFDWTVARRLSGAGRIMLAGGLDPGNIIEAVHTAEPWGVDVSSGVESAPGVKDHALMRDLFTELRKK